MKLLLIGHGKMGRLVETLAPGEGFDVVGAVDENTTTDWPAADVAIDFSIGAAVPGTVARLAQRRTPIVIGTTGWQEHEKAVRDLVAAAGIGVVAAPNFAIGVNVFLAVVDRMGALMAAQPSFGAWIHEAHHAAKLDAPSGTALAMEQRLRRQGYSAEVPIASTRAGNDSRHAHARLRRGVGNDYAHAPGAGSRRLRAWRAAGGPLAGRPPGLVFDDGCTRTVGGQHETTIHGLRDRAGDAVQDRRLARRSGGLAPCPAADRARHPFPRAVRNDRRGARR